MDCDKCGKEMSRFVGMTVSIQSNDLNENDKLELKRQLGKYTADSYNICYECLIDNMLGRSG